MNVRSFTIYCSFLALIALTVFSVGCKKGDMGPEGPAGAQGPAGPAGAQGPKGDSGTANVIYSNWLDVSYDPVTDTNNNVVDTVAWVAEIPAPGLTNTILNSGNVKVYVNAGTATQPAVFPLPITDLYALTGVLNINVYFTQQKINLYATDDASTFTSTAGGKGWQYRYILIPGGTPGGRYAQIDWNDYNAVKNYLGLKD